MSMHKKISLILAVLLLAAALPMAVLATEIETPAPATDTPATEVNTPPPVETPKATDEPKDTDAPATTKPTATAAVSGLPVITKDPKDETVEVGGRAPFTSRAKNAKGRTWYFVSPDGKEVLTVKEAKTKFKGITVTGEHEEKLVIKKVTKEMDGWCVLCNFYNDKGNVDSAMAAIHIKTKATATPKVTATPAPEGLPTITKDPTKETVTEGGSCSFVARADNTDAYDWFFTKGSKTYTVTEALKKFSGLKVSGEETEKLKLRKIPLSLDGWKVYCVFTNENGEIWSKTALITVKEAEEEATPKATAKATATNKPTDAPTPTATNAPSTSSDPVAPVTSSDPVTPVTSPDNSLEPTTEPTIAPTDTPEPVVPSTEPEPPSTEPDDPEDGGTNTVLVAALIGMGVLLVGGGVGTAVILSKRNQSIMDMDDEE